MKSQQKNEILSKVIEISSADSQISDRLTQIARFLCLKGVAPTLAFYLLHPRGRRLVLRIAADSGGALRIPAPACTYRLPAPEIPLCRPLGTLLPNPLEPENTPSHDQLLQRHPHGWCLPLADETRAYGIMALLNGQPFSVPSDSIRFLQVICRQITLALRSSMIQERDRLLVHQLKFLHQIGARLNADSDIESIFSQLPDSAPAFFANSLSRLHIFATDLHPATIMDFGGHDPEQQAVADRVSRSQSDRVRFLSHPLVIDRRNGNRSDNNAYREFFSHFLLHIILPLPSRNQNLGTLEFFLINTPESRELLPLDGEELELLEILAVHLAATIERTRTRDQLATASRTSLLRNRQLTLLHQIKNALLAANTVERIIRLTLGALVSREGFACPAALYIECGDNPIVGEVFYALSAAAPAAASPTENDELDHGEELARQLLTASEKLPEEARKKLIGLTLPPLETTPPRFQQALADGKPVIIPARLAFSIDSRLENLLEGQKIVIIPLAGQEKASGLIMGVADHISEDDLNYITLFTDAAGLALDNIRLYQRLQDSLASLNNAQMRLAQSEKLVALGEMATSIAHEIKNPLVSIGGFARRLHRKIPDQSREKTYSRIITKEIERLEGIVNNVLSFSRPEVEDYTPHDLNLLIRETTDLFTRELKKRQIELQLDLLPDLPPVECDGNQIKQVLINLLNNSIQALSDRKDGERGFIRIRSSSFSELESRRQAALIEIEDNGGGIQESVIHDIFNPFFTTKHEGTGLGLTICYRIILNHQGDIRLHNQIGRGVTVIITLPLKRQ
ncbi:MAG: hypothetical protein GXO34_03750 [Deltaproteobacteria bacterium]|nr:hypothetical protein [Deltaproteobacteria bacterium]